ncbi:MAG: AEC family transporter [Alloprevotella sp.]
MDLFRIVTQMLMIFGVVLTGFVAAKKGIWPVEINKKISVFVLDISAPCLILTSVMGEGMVFERSEIISLMLVSIINYAILIAAAYLVTHIWDVGERRIGILRFCMAFGNVTFIGFPAVTAVFGPRGVFYAAVLTIPFNLLIFTIGMHFVRGAGRLTEAFSPRLLFSPCVVAALAAVVLAFFKVETNPSVAQFFHLLGDMTIPCALLIIGASMTTIPAKRMVGNPFIYCTTVLKLVAMPLLVLTIFRLLGMDGLAVDVAVLLTAMPVAANGVMFCLKLGRDEREMAQAIFFTTLMAVFTIPFIALLF